MKKSNLTMLAAVALTALLALTPSAKAATYVAGDLFLGFRASGGQGQTTNYVINLGQASLFKSGGTYATGSLISLGNFSTDLNNTYGSWASRSDLSFAVIGGSSSAASGDASRTFYLSRNEITLGTQADAWLGKASSAQNTVLTNSVTGVGIGFNTNVPVAGSNAGFKEDTTASYGSSGSAWQGAASSGVASTAMIDNLTSNYGADFEATFVNGANSTALDLFRMAPTNGSTGTYIGRFTISNTGDLSFQAAAVPEPSTYALLALGGLALFALHRMRNQGKAKA